VTLLTSAVAFNLSHQSFCLILDGGLTLFFVSNTNVIPSDPQSTSWVRRLGKRLDLGSSRRSDNRIHEDWFTTRLSKLDSDRCGFISDKILHLTFGYVLIHEFEDIVAIAMNI